MKKTTKKQIYTIRLMFELGRAYKVFETPPDHYWGIIELDLAKVKSSKHTALYIARKLVSIVNAIRRDMTKSSMMSKGGEHV